MSELYAALAGSSGFASDPRYGGGAPRPEPLEAEDPLTQTWQQGYAAGFAEAQHTARELAEAETEGRAGIELSLARLDAELAEQLRQKLFATVEALCAAVIAPLALDQVALAARVERAAAMLARADDDKLLRLNPDDLKLVAKQLPKGLEVLEDPALERGALRIESQSGGVEDGPAHWRRAIAEALAQC
ncbi:MAG: flagellar biosynthesis protein [Novosphingobium sp.]|nr:flagellar biosynthesis protein [Novosphingobium sp.]